MWLQFARFFIPLLLQSVDELIQEIHTQKKLEDESH